MSYDRNGERLTTLEKYAMTWNMSYELSKTVKLNKVSINNSIDSKCTLQMGMAIITVLIFFRYF